MLPRGFRWQVLDLYEPGPLYLEGRSEASEMASEASADLSDFLTVCLVISVLFAQENLFLVVLLSPGPSRFISVIQLSSQLYNGRDFNRRAKVRQVQSFYLEKKTPLMPCTAGF